MPNTFLCPRCGKEHETLEARLTGDEQLLEHYRHKLPVKGRAGKLDCTEREFAIRVTPWRQRLSKRAARTPFARQEGVKQPNPPRDTRGGSDA